MNERALKKARELRGLSIYELAKRSGLSWATVAAAEKGRRKPHGNTLRILVNALDKVPVLPDLSKKK